MNKDQKVQAIIDKIKAELTEQFVDRPITPQTKEQFIESMKNSMISHFNHIAKNESEQVKFNVTQNGDMINVKACNIYTLLLMHGIRNVSPKQLEGLTEYQTEIGKLVVGEKIN